MDKFIEHHGIIAVILRDNIDTDAIIPSREMKGITKTGLADGLFAAWRYLDEKNRTANPDFILNQTPCNKASIIISGNNFGCGSSREHAVWALKEFGVRCLIAESYGNIFQRNCISNGILPVALSKQSIEKIINTNAIEVAVNLPEQTVFANQLAIKFDISDTDKEMLIEGLDPIAVTQKLQDKISYHRKRDRDIRPWAYL